MGRTILGFCVALLLSTTLVASPCVVCFKTSSAKTAHDCCKKKPEPPKPCGLEFSELATPDVPVAKILPAPAPMPVVADVAGVTLLTPASGEVWRIPAYTPPPLYLLDTVFLI